MEGRIGWEVYQRPIVLATTCLSNFLRYIWSKMSGYQASFSHRALSEPNAQEIFHMGTKPVFYCTWRVAVRLHVIHDPVLVSRDVGVLPFGSLNRSSSPYFVVLIRIPDLGGSLITPGDGLRQRNAPCHAQTLSSGLADLPNCFCGAAICSDRSKRKSNTLFPLLEHAIAYLNEFRTRFNVGVQFL